MTEQTKNIIQKQMSKANIKNTLAYMTFYSNLSVDNYIDELEIQAINHMLQILYISINYCIDNNIPVESAEQFSAFIERVRNNESIKITETLKLESYEIDYKLLYAFIISDTSTFDKIIKEFTKLPHINVLAYE